MRRALIERVVDVAGLVSAGITLVFAALAAARLALLLMGAAR